jgi:large subunit ribosomal protein L2
MPVRIYKPTSNGRRNSSVSDFSDITKKRPEKSLVVLKKKTGGRNMHGIITTRHRGGGAKLFLRLVDFLRNKYDVPATVLAIEYDPNRGSRLALIQYEGGEKSYIIQPEGLKVGDTVVSSKSKIEAKTGNRMPLEFIPSGLFVHAVENCALDLFEVDKVPEFL